MSINIIGISNFLNLILVNDGVIISYNDYSDYNDSSISLQNIGVLLGYSFYENFNHITGNSNTYTIHINVKLKNGLIINLFSNICHDVTEHIIEFFNIFVETAMDTFNNEKYRHLLGESQVIDIHTEIISNNYK